MVTFTLKYIHCGSEKLVRHGRTSHGKEAYQKVIPEEQHTAVGKETGETAQVERWNNILRQRLARFVRKTLSFSKSDLMHEICLRLFLHRYNLECVT